MTDLPVRVLHVEPDDDFAADAREALERFAPEVDLDRVATADDATGRLADGTYDAVVAAGELPDRSGIDLLAAVRENDPDLPFLLVTGAGSETVAAEAVREGATDYLRKGQEEIFGTLAARLRPAVAGYRAELARRERSKELATLHAANAILAADRPLDDRLSELTTALPAGWRHPERTAARIRVDGRTFATPNFAETPHEITATATVEGGVDPGSGGGEVGSEGGGAEFAPEENDGSAGPPRVEVAVAYVGAVHEGDEPFLPEEKRLLDSVTAVVAAHVGRERSIDRLRASTDRLETILEHTTNLVFMKDLDGRYLLVNDAFAEFVGREKDAIIGETVETVHTDPIAERVTAHDREAVAAGEPTRFEEHVAVDGEQRTFLTVRVPLFDNDGVPYAVYGIATDITAQRRAADERATLLDRMTDGLMAVDTGDTITYINDHGAEMAGFEPAEIVGVDLREAFERTNDAFLAAYDRAIEREEAETVETYHPPADAWYESRIYPDETGASVYFRDVSDRVRDRRRLEQFEHIVESVHDGVLVVDASGEIRFVNQYVVDRLDRDALVGSDVATLLRPSDRGRVREALDRLAAGETHDGSTVEVTVDAADGPLPVEVRKTPLYHDGEFWGVVAVVRDVTERHAERRELEYREGVMRRLYETIAEKDTDFETKVRGLLTLGKEVIGTESGLLSRVDGEDYVGLVVEDDTGAFEEGMVVDVGVTNCERVVATEQSLQVKDVGEVPDLAERGGYTQLGISCYVGAPVVVDGEVFGTFCFYDRGAREEPFDRWEVTLVDLMARWVSYELERRRTQAELERERDRLEEFASVVSHDLRNPLNVAEGHVDLAREGDEAADLDAAATALARMNELIDDALSFARLGTRVVETDPTAIGAVAREAWETVDTGGASLTVEDLGVAACDASRVRSLFENLFRNAVEHVGPDVRVTVGRLEDGFYVADDGPGIPEDVREHVFERGYTTSETGTGFGLAIVDQIAGAHGWAVDLADGDTDETGARFEIRDVNWVRS
ncbi:PAS domain-containing protein [Haloparvum sedimenti]|uniref:PAS domain-containing protein n=1 Tax=Haloparvum sedimenti TaxID=1678448 RepID=UPI00071E760C|nr:PAS domain-containing protein [Haloparvum sedimenti]